LSKELKKRERVPLTSGGRAFQSEERENAKSLRKEYATVLRNMETAHTAGVE
jgi:hypothetical protein